tara:strand:+ start:348 stop:533 length:186 start_codon:yes stop_codon:yes gene_type:complete
MNQTPKMRKQISLFSKWLEMKENEELHKVGVAPMNPHDPPNGGENMGASGLKIELYGKKIK